MVSDRQHSCSSLSAEGGWHPWQDLEWFCEKYPAQMQWEWGCGEPRTSHRNGKPLRDTPIQGQEGLGMDSRGPCLLQTIQTWGHPSSRSVHMPASTQSPQILQFGPFRQENIWWRCFEGEMDRGVKVCHPTTKHYPNGLRETSKIGGPSHNHALLPRLQLVSRNTVAKNRPTEAVSATTVASLEYNKWGKNPKVIKAI